eukprot:TRINITY_DN1652_c4_g1_i1.p1 TRINITY_DN1652_c4_g1~~TRINITY_DN1652_c4_g1_i1.p1  ORF type:complete len:379 (+),score=109.18 TRINITY_DN1652_c4_g1_i1:53-1138(+)
MRAMVPSLLLLPAAVAFVRHQALPVLRAGTRTSAPHMSAAPATDTESLGDKIERALIIRFGKDKVQRVVDCFNKSRKGEAFEMQWPDKGLQQASSYMEGLFAEPWHDAADGNMYPWAAKLEQQAGVIASELKAVMAKKGVEKQGTNIWSVAARDDALAYGPDWRTLVLQDRVWDPVNMELFPKTATIVQECGIPSCEVFFAKQAPRTGIKPHTDDTNFILTAHLGLDVPEGECRMTVGDETREWRNNKMLIFDTSFVHSTANDSDRPRTVLLMRFFHPEVTADERRALQFIFEVVDNPLLVSDDDPAVASANAAAAAAAAAGKSVPLPVAEAEPLNTEGMTRQERRQLEREQKKKAAKRRG